MGFIVFGMIITLIAAGMGIITLSLPVALLMLFATVFMLFLGSGTERVI